MKTHFCESLWCKAWQLRWKLQQTVVFNIWDDFASMTYARHTAECKWLWVGEKYFSPTFIPALWLKLTESDKQPHQNLLVTSRWNTLNVRVFFFWTCTHEYLWLCWHLRLIVFRLNNNLTIAAKDIFGSVSRSAHHLWPFVCCSACLLSADEKF